MTLIIGTCTDSLLTLTGESFSREETTSKRKVYPIADRWIAGQAGGQLTLLDPAKYDFSTRQLRSGFTEPNAWLRHALCSDFVEILERRPPKLPSTVHIGAAWPTIRDHIFGLYEAEAEFARAHRYAPIAYNEQFVFGGFDARGRGRLVRSDLTGDSDSGLKRGPTRALLGRDVAEPVNDFCYPDPTNRRGLMFLGSGQPLASAWLAETDFPWCLSREEDVVALVESAMSATIDASADTSPRLSYPVRVLILRRGSEPTELVLN